MNDGLLIPLTEMDVNLAPDGSMTIIIGDHEAKFTPEQTRDLFLLFKQTPGVTSIINRAFLKRCREAWQEGIL